MPIYYIIGAYVPNQHSYGIIQILKVIETTLDAVMRGDLDQAMREYYGKGLNLTSYLVLREPDNPFKEKVTGD